MDLPAAATTSSGSQIINGSAQTGTLQDHSTERARTAFEKAGLSSKDIVEALRIADRVRAIIAAERISPEALTTFLLGDGPAVSNCLPKRLSSREMEIVQYVGLGFKNADIAIATEVSQQTVKNHLHNIFNKLGLSSRWELPLYATGNAYTDGPLAGLSVVVVKLLQGLAKGSKLRTIRAELGAGQTGFLTFVKAVYNRFNVSNIEELTTFAKTCFTGDG